MIFLLEIKASFLFQPSKKQKAVKRSRVTKKALDKKLAPASPKAPIGRPRKTTIKIKNKCLKTSTNVQEGEQPSAPNKKDKRKSGKAKEASPLGKESQESKLKSGAVRIENSLSAFGIKITRVYFIFTSAKSGEHLFRSK